MHQNSASYWNYQVQNIGLVYNYKTNFIMKRKVYHVTYDKSNDEWKGKMPGAGRSSTTGDTKKEVVEKVTELAKDHGHSQVVIHLKNGRIETEHTYGSDPEKYPG
jgi:hypothetical protein